MSDVTELPTRPKLTVVPPPRMTPETFWERGQAMIAQMYPGNAPTIRLGDPEYEAWATYFQKYLRWQPSCLKALQQRNLHSMTVPAQWPEWFDTDYQKPA